MSRRVWVATVPADYEYGLTSFQVMIEQFDDNPPSIAFRPVPQATWGPPIESEER